MRTTFTIVYTGKDQRSRIVRFLRYHQINVFVWFDNISINQKESSQDEFNHWNDLLIRYLKGKRFKSSLKSEDITDNVAMDYVFNQIRLIKVVFAIGCNA